MANEKLTAGIAAFKKGDKATASKFLLEVVREEPNNEIAWLWLTGCAKSEKKKIECLSKVLAINPNNLKAKEALKKLPSHSDTISVETQPSTEEIMSGITLLQSKAEQTAPMYPSSSVQSSPSIVAPQLSETSPVTSDDIRIGIIQSHEIIEQSKRNEKALGILFLETFLLSVGIGYEKASWLWGIGSFSAIIVFTQLLAEYKVTRIILSVLFGLVWGLFFGEIVHRIFNSSHNQDLADNAARITLLFFFLIGTGIHINALQYLKDKADLKKLSKK